MGMHRSRVWAVALLGIAFSALVATWSFTASASAAGAPGSIAGTVTEYGAVDAIEGAYACVEGEEEIGEEEWFYQCARTDASGGYVIEGVPAGSYKIEFSPGDTNFQREYYDDVSSWGEATLVEVEPARASPARTRT